MLFEHLKLYPIQNSVSFVFLHVCFKNEIHVFAHSKDSEVSHWRCEGWESPEILTATWRACGHVQDSGLPLEICW
jgi:hypothetical protein